MSERGLVCSWWIASLCVGVVLVWLIVHSSKWHTFCDRFGCKGSHFLTGYVSFWAIAVPLDGGRDNRDSSSTVIHVLLEMSTYMHSGS